MSFLQHLSFGNWWCFPFCFRSFYWLALWTRLPQCARNFSFCRTQLL